MMHNDCADMVAHSAHLFRLWYSLLLIYVIQPTKIPAQYIPTGRALS